MSKLQQQFFSAELDMGLRKAQAAIRAMGFTFIHASCQNNVVLPSSIDLAVVARKITASLSPTTVGSSLHDLAKSCVVIITIELEGCCVCFSLRIPKPHWYFGQKSKHVSQLTKQCPPSATSVPFHKKLLWCNVDEKECDDDIETLWISGEEKEGSYPRRQGRRNIVLPRD